MAIPNTTPTPNELYNGEMKKMSDTELRVVLLITRATLGWEIDHKTGMRKTEDWISQKLLMEKSGRSNKAIATAIDNSIKKEWIEARDKNGKLLDTPQKRSGNRVYYRLGKIFLDKISYEDSSQDTSEEITQDSQTCEHFSQTCELNDTKPVKKVHSTKETVTKETIQKQFDQFYLSYPKRVQKSVALKSWIKLSPSPSLFQAILKDIEKKKKSRNWLKDDGQYIPYPATYLNQRRWEDEEEQKESLKERLYYGLGK